MYGGGDCSALKDVCMNFAKSRLHDLKNGNTAAFRECKFLLPNSKKQTSVRD
jgi:hypothetical protein